MGASAKVTTNAPAIPDARVMMFLLLRSSAPNHLTQARRAAPLDRWTRNRKGQIECRFDHLHLMRM
jgi:hypothetical protein